VRARRAKVHRILEALASQNVLLNDAFEYFGERCLLLPSFR
jgi:hypothetical protein